MIDKNLKLTLPTNEDINKYPMLSELLESLYEETKDLSKKAPKDCLNEFKVKNINRVLIPIKQILAKQPSVEFLDLLDSETLPTYSDAILVLAQYQAALKQFRNTYYVQDASYKYHWLTQESSNK